MLFLIVLDSAEGIPAAEIKGLTHSKPHEIAKNTFLFFPDNDSVQKVEKRLELMAERNRQLKHYYVIRLDRFAWKGMPHSPEIKAALEDQIAEGELPGPASFS